ncbi:hypothetical protein N7489_007839 [Penicillium chrysogenum]|uniref:Rhodopsin domain-containing protein n=1 Tax=Penicillium chrysogenum TaxID=5076 RepID=A0ABQ8WBZ6_PENCH|nr:uncharacterized protein N7489_007839 [Penicillium chrysogenum]KAJ5237748.1 hypothetical protein N7489_007839 [Penicillium chrysogenum]KAJ5261992.1 hypothetical protein N7505_008859 [Penicillium chrysogenum]KAJ5278045.1 hypothetical protein N7524_004198 [Penicillium chrysogenum]
MAGSMTDVAKTGEKGPEMMAVMWTMTALATLLVIARLCIRQRMLRNFGFDDWLIGASMIFGLIFVATATVSVTYGYGQHMSNLDPKTVEPALMWNMISFIFGIISFAIPKLAVAALLHRILNPSLIQRITVWGLVILVAIIALINILIYVTMCNPPRALWKPSMILKGEATCRDVWILINYATFNGAFSAFVDLFLAIYPGVVLFKLQMSLRKKIALTAALGLGSIAAATAMVKCAQIKGLADQTDPTFSTVPLVVWTNVEANVVVIAACIPTLQPMLELILRKLKLVSTFKGHSKPSSYAQYKIYDNQSSSPAYVSKKERTTPSRKESQESILNDMEQYQIRRTDEVHVEYEMQQSKAAPE